MKRIVLTIALGFLSCMLFAQSGSKQGKIKHLMEVSGSGALGQQVATQMIKSFKDAYPDVDQAFWNELIKEIHGEDLERLIMPIYDKYYTEAEVDQLITFDESPLGQKMLSSLPDIMSESMQVGREWGQTLAKNVMEKLKNKGYLQRTSDDLKHGD